MALFVKRPNIGDTANLYTVGEEKKLLIVGLGNIGKEYIGTRHNIGYEVLDYFAGKQGFPDWVVNKDRKCAETSLTIGSSRVYLCKPTTFMNLSGEAVQAMQHFYKIANSSTLAVYDEVDVDFSQIRTRKGGSAAGHNGVKSLITHCGEDFGRLRVGVGPKKPAQMDLADFVLSKFTKAQSAELSLLLTESNSLLSEYAHSGGQLLEETRAFIF